MRACDVHSCGELFVSMCVFVSTEMTAYQERIIIWFCLTVKIMNAFCYVLLVDNRLIPQHYLFRHVQTGIGLNQNNCMILDLSDISNIQQAGTTIE